MLCYRVVLSNETVEVFGNPECRQYGALFFTDEYGNILRLFAPGEWKSVELIAPVTCHVCGGV